MKIENCLTILSYTLIWLENHSVCHSYIKSVNLWYNTVGRRDDDMIVLPSDGPIFILIDWEWFSETVVSWLSPRAFQTVTKELDFIFLSCKEMKNI